MHFNYPEEVMDGTFNLNVSSEQPLLSIILNTNTMNMDYFVSTPPDVPKTISVSAKKTWSEDLIDTSWMEGFAGTFDISIGKLNYGQNGAG